MNKISLALLCICLSGCNLLHKMLPNTDTSRPGVSALPDIYTVEGTTTIDYQIIQPVRCVNSGVTVSVLRPGEAQWKDCNPYEVKIDTTGVGGGGVWFKRRLDVTYNSLGQPISFYVYGTPVAPIGTKYRITSVLISD